mgnify:CR=1 FL=1
MSIMFFLSCGMNIKNKKINPVGSKNENKVNIENPPHFVANSSHYQTNIIPPNSVLMGYLIDGYKPTKAQFEQMTHIAISFLRPYNSSGKVVMTFGIGKIASTPFSAAASADSVFFPKYHKFPPIRPSE